MYDEILDAIIERLAKTKHIQKASMSETTLFVEDLNGKSLEIAHLATFLEAEFDVDLPYMKFSKQRTLGDMARFVEESM
ncbi:MAG: acyl carrier protein [Saccharofermentanales bacterium]|jgi:acyl carrier protein|nr:hypothetical protein [Clostridiaceae bacterium]